MLPELLDVHAADDPVDLEQVGHDPLIARRLLIELAVNARRAEKLRATLAAIHGEYEGRLAGLAERDLAARRWLQAFVERNGRVSFPDVGSATLARRKPALRVTDAEAAAAYLREHHADTPGAAESEVTFRITDEGKALLRGALEGEGIIPDGCDVAPAAQSLQVRGLR